MSGSWAANAKRQREPWKAPFCGCFDDLSSCLLSFCCPCVQYGFNAQRIDGSGCFGACCMYACCMMCAGYQCAIGGGKRTSMRNQYMLEESCCCDCCVHWCCCWCALSQEARELDIRGPPPDRSQMPNIIVQQSTNMPSPHGVMMTNVNGQLSPVPQHGAYMLNQQGQMVMMHPGQQMMYAPQPGYPPEAYMAQQGQPMAQQGGQPMQMQPQPQQPQYMTNGANGPVPQYSYDANGTAEGSFQHDTSPKHLA